MTNLKLLKVALRAALVFFGVLVLYWAAAGFVVLNWDITTWTEFGRMALLISPLVTVPLFFAIMSGVSEDVL